MILSTVSQDKAKYKVMFKDWLVALCLLFVMHYIMVGILNISDTITEAIGTSGEAVSMTDQRNAIKNNLEKANKENNDWNTYDQGVIDKVKEALKVSVIYFASVIMNYIFIFKYTIRAIIIIFLSLLAPITCITYPIDKISDGKAQAYDMWFKEFLYNVIIQPFHLLIYVVLIGSAAELASENLIYAMLCFGVMIPAEKFIKQMFGFKDKLGSPLGAFASGAVANQLMNSMKSIGKGASGGNKDNNSSKEDSIPPATKELKLPGTENENDGNNGPGSRPGIEGTQEDGTETNDPTENDPTANDPTANAPTENDPTANDPTENDPTENDPAANDPTENDPTENDPTANDPTANDPAANDPTANDPTENDPAANDSTENDPTENDPAANDPAANDPTTNGSTTNGTRSANNTKKPNIVKRAANRINDTKAAKVAKARFNRNLERKYGSNKIKDIAAGKARNAGKKIYSGAKKGGKKLIKGVASGALGLGLFAFGSMFGVGKEAGAVGLAIGNRVGGAAANQVDKLSEKAEGYAGEIWDAYGNHAENKERREFKQNDNNIKLARQNFRERHEGADPTGDELDTELENMYKMKSHGIDKNQYQDVLKQYEEYKDPDGEYKLSEDEAMNNAMFSAKVSKDYSTKDFRDEKAMTPVFNEYMNQLIDAGHSEDEAYERVSRIMKGAGAMKNVKNVAIPPKKEKQTFARTMLKSRGISQPNEQQLELAEEMHVKLQEAGYEEDQILQIADNIDFNENMTSTELNRKLKVYVDYEAGEGRINIIKEFLGNDASAKDIRQEYIERLEVEKVFGLQGENNQSRVTAIRAYEKNKGNTGNRELAGRMIKGDISEKELYETKMSDKTTASHYMELVTGNKRAIQTEMDRYNGTETKKSEAYSDKQQGHRKSTSAKDKGGRGSRGTKGGTSRRRVEAHIKDKRVDRGTSDSSEKAGINTVVDSSIDND